MNLDVHYSSERVDWATPQFLFDGLHAEFGFELDVCATKENAKCRRFFTPDDDGLSQPWEGVRWMNPPYGREIRRWTKEAVESAREGALVVCLVPARTDTRWWHQYATLCDIRYLGGCRNLASRKTRRRFRTLSSSSERREPETVRVYRRHSVTKFQFQTRR